MASYNTWQAYNEAGGASFYRYHLDYDCDYKNSMFLSFQRPIYNIKGKEYEGGGYEAELGITHWLEREDIPFHVTTDRDFHYTDFSPNDYKAIVLTTHSEYWTEKMYDKLD